MVILVIGENEYACKKRLDTLIGDKQASFVDLSELENIDNLIEKIQGASLFGGEEIVVVRYLEDAKAMHESFLKSVKNIEIKNTLIIYLPGLKPSNPLAKKLVLLADNNFLESNLSDLDLAKWVIGTVEKSGGSINMATARFLIEWSGDNQFSLENEIDKLLSYKSHLTKESIQDVAIPAPRTTIFQMLDAMMKRDTKKASKYLDDLRAQQFDSDYVMSMICWQANAMNVAFMGKNDNVQDLAKNSGISAFVLTKAKSLVAKLSKKEMFLINEYILDTDLKLKTASLDKEQLINHLINKVASI